VIASIQHKRFVERVDATAQDNASCVCIRTQHRLRLSKGLPWRVDRACGCVIARRRDEEHLAQRHGSKQQQGKSHTRHAESTARVGALSKLAHPDQKLFRFQMRDVLTMAFPSETDVVADELRASDALCR
jgi:hypothetical protein